MKPIRPHFNILSSQAARLNPSSLLTPLLLLGIVLSLSGCEMKLPPMPWDPPPTESNEQGAKGEHAASAESEAGGDEDETSDDESSGVEGNAPSKLTAIQQLPYEDITIPLPDQLILSGRLYDPSLSSQGENELPDAEEYQGPKYPLVILLHGLNRSYDAWADLPVTLTKAGYAVFALDLRGHGKSTTTTWKRRVSWRYLTPEQWKAMHRDIGQVIQFFKKGEIYPEVDGSHVALVGEKLGANIATFAAKYNQEVQTLVLISPGLEFKGIDASRGLLEYDKNTLIMSNQDSKESHNQARHLYNWITGPKTLQVYEKIGEGADMLTNQPSVNEQIREWLDRALTPVSGKSSVLHPATETTSSSHPTPQAHPEKATQEKETPIETGHNSPAAKRDTEPPHTEKAPAPSPTATPSPKSPNAKSAHH